MRATEGTRTVTLHCPNGECDAEFETVANWWNYPATGPTYSSGGEPPDSGVEFDGGLPNHCPKCDTDFDADSVMDDLIEQAWKQIDVEDDGKDDEGPDFEEFYEQYKEGRLDALDVNMGDEEPPV